MDVAVCECGHAHLVSEDTAGLIVFLPCTVCDCTQMVLDTAVAMDPWQELNERIRELGRVVWADRQSLFLFLGSVWLLFLIALVVVGAIR